MGNIPNPPQQYGKRQTRAEETESCLDDRPGGTSQKTVETAVNFTDCDIEMTHIFNAPSLF